MKNTNKKAVRTLWAGHATVDIYSGFVNPIMPFLAANLGITLAVSTFILSLSHLCSSMMQPIFGYLSDFWRKRFFMFFGLLLSSMFLPLLGFAHNVYTLSAFLIIGSIGNGFFHPQATSFVNIYSSPKDLAKNMSIFLAIGTLGFSLGPVVSSFFIQFFGAKVLSLTSIIGLTVAALILINVPKISDKISKVNNIHFRTAVKEIFTSKPMLILIMFSALKSLATQSCSILLPFLWKSLGYSAMNIGMLLFFFLIAGAAGTVASAKLEKMIGTKQVMVMSFCAILPLTLLFAFTYKTLPFVSFGTFILIGFFAMLSVPINMVLAHQVMPQYKSLISGFIGGFSWGIVGLSMSLCGLLAQNFGIVNVLIVVAILPTACSILVKYVPDRQY
ncbi:MAG: MFS transporter [Candidatus Gastranaerophilales bacterium]|nr:MFS transporter [Candidatus Gastranaerophilales bacterium]